MNDSSQSNNNDSSQGKCTSTTRIVIVISISIVLIVVLYTIIQLLYIRYKKWKKGNHTIDIKHASKDIEAQDAHISAFEVLEERNHTSTPPIPNESVNLFEMLQSNPFSSLGSLKQSNNGISNSNRVTNSTIPDIRSRRSSLAPSLKIKTILSSRDPQLYRGHQTSQFNRSSNEQYQLQSKTLKNNNIYPVPDLSRSEPKNIQTAQNITQLSPQPLKRSHSTSLLPQPPNDDFPYL